MAIQKKQKQSIFPDYPRESPIVDNKGILSNQWDLAFNSLFQALQTNFKNEGILFPALDGTSIAAIEAIYAPYIGFPLPQDMGSQTFIPDISGQTVFDTTARVPKQFIITFDGSTPPNVLTAAWKTFTLT